MKPPAPDLAGFAEAQDRKRSLLGAAVVFLQPPTLTWPPGTPLNPVSGKPFDPTIAASASAQVSASARCGVFFKAVTRGGAAGNEVASPVGFDEKTRIFVIVGWDDRAVVDGASELIFHDDRFKIEAVKDDEIVTGYKRRLVYAAAEGT